MCKAPTIIKKVALKLKILLSEFSVIPAHSEMIGAS